MINPAAATPHTSRRWSRLAAAGLLAAVAGVPLLGCDDVSDTKALKLQTEAAALRSVGAVPNDKVESNLKTVADNERLSTAIVQGQHAYGQYLLAKANTEAATLAAAQRDAASTIFRIGDLLRQAEAARIRAENVRAMDPAKRVAAAGAFANEVRGSGNQATFAVISAGNDAKDVPTLSTLAAAQQEKSRLDGEITKLKESIAQLTQQRDAALAQAGQIGAAMESQSTADRVKSTQQAAELNRRAADLSRQLAEQNNALMRASADNALQVALIEQLNGAVEATEQQSQAMQKGWTDLSATADQQLNAARALVEGGGANGASVKQLLGDLSKKLEEIKTQRQAVVDSYQAAVDQLAKAANSAGTVSGDITSAKTSANEAFEGKAWDELLSLLNTDRINLDRANATRALADAQADQARLLTEQLQTAKLYDDVSKGLRVQTPKEFDSAALTTQLNEALNAADKSYGDADDLLEGISLSKPEVQNLRSAKATTKILGLYAHATLCRLAGLAEAGGELPKKADKLIESAKAAADDAINANNLSLPPLPPEVTVQKKAPPAEQPADAAPPATGDKPADTAVPTTGDKPADAPAGAETPTPDGQTPAGGETPAPGAGEKPAEPAAGTTGA